MGCSLFCLILFNVSCRPNHTASITLSELLIHHTRISRSYMSTSPHLPMQVPANIRGDKREDIMTQEQRAQVLKLRREGYGYKKIGGILHVSVNTIKSYCKNNPISENEPESRKEKSGEAVVCKNCGKALIQPKGRKQIKFCSGKCRTEWWNSHPDAVNRKAYYTAVCQHCGREFIAYGNSRRKYCCHECYIADRFGHGRGDGYDA